MPYEAAVLYQGYEPGEGWCCGWAVWFVVRGEHSKRLKEHRGEEEPERSGANKRKEETSGES